MAGWNPAQALPVITCATCTRNRRSMLKDYADCTPLNAANDETRVHMRMQVRGRAGLRRGELPARGGCNANILLLRPLQPCMLLLCMPPHAAACMTQSILHAPWTLYAPADTVHVHACVHVMCR